VLCVRGMQVQVNVAVMRACADSDSCRSLPIADAVLDLRLLKVHLPYSIIHTAIEREMC
jgi:hypothetical protein